MDLKKSPEKSTAKFIKPFRTLDNKIQNLLREANEAMNFAYAPYSNFKVGVALMCDDGSIYTGCNVENSSFPVGICAEKVAYGKAISCGKNKFSAVAIASQDTKPTLPCGGCRQFISEFGSIEIYCANSDLADVFACTIEDILPFYFQLQKMN